ncbi:MAG: flagellar basal-body MS-ring/collar protein FliF [Thermaerobacter sp.]|nr:flagellar basal-body MS-ring/collar protein FliF [Thermaerobacter sp.]
MARTPEPGSPPAGGADLSRIFSSAQGFWSSRAPSERRRYVTLGVALVVLVFAATYFLTRNPMTLVFYNLNAADAGQVTQQLTSLKIPYQLKGTSIYVPSSMADQARVDLATQGLPAQGSVGYSSVLQSSGLGETSQQFTLATLNALQADLATTIESISGVQKANVYIYQSQPSVFVDQATSQATASVFVDLMPGVSLSPRQVLGIQDLVAHAVGGGLRSADVSVEDQSGNSLASAGSATNPSANGGSSEIGLQQQFQNELDGQIAALLTPIVGKGNVIVQTNATLDLTQTSSKSTIVQPLPSGQGVPVSDHTIKETFTGTGTPPTVSGSSSVPTYPSSTGGTNSLNYTDSTINYDVTKVNQTVTSQPFTLKGLTVSVTLNSRVYHLTGANQRAIQKLIATAVGYTNSKKAAADITIFSAPFAKAPAPNFGNTSTLPSPIVLAGAAAGVVVLLLVLFLILRRRPKVQVQRLQPPPLSPPPAPDPSRQVLDRVRTLVQDDPEEAAQLVRGWLREDSKDRARRRG